MAQALIDSNITILTQNPHFIITVEVSQNPHFITTVEVTESTLYNNKWSQKIQTL